ncbi:MAG: hypothetical protein R6U20_07415 [Longimonas sp.]|uniref:hypothetical protein n=1 Tax=Longimonas sp. TaxID=2039626 RepID=UPI003976039F
MRRFAWVCGIVIIGGGLALALSACENGADERAVERGTFVMTLDGSVQDTVRGTAYLRGAENNEPGLELDADSIGWSVHWSEVEGAGPAYTIMPHALLQASQDHSDDSYPAYRSEDDEPGASLFMEYGRLGSFEAQAGTLTVEQQTDTEHIGRIQATLTDPSGARAEVTVEGHWHAIPAPDTVPSHLQP